MLTIRLLTTDEEERYGFLDPSAETRIYGAFSGEELLAHTVFTLTDDAIVLKDLESDPKDFCLVDGVARAAIAYAEDLGKTLALVDGDGEELLIFSLSVGFTDGSMRIAELFAVPPCSGERSACEGCAGGCGLSFPSEGCPQ